MNPQPVSLAERLQREMNAIDGLVRVMRLSTHPEKSAREQLGLAANLLEEIRSELSALLAQHAVAEPPLPEESMQVREWRVALQRIANDDDGSSVCHCECGDDENCCEKVDEFCPHCIAQTVLQKSAPAHAAEQPKFTERITPQMMSEVFAKSVNNTDPEHQHIYDHRIAADALNALLTPAHAAEQPKFTEEQVQSIFVPMLNERAGSWEPFPWDKLVERLNRLLTSPVAPPPQVTVSQGGLPNASPPSWAKPEWAEWTYDPATSQFQPPVAPGEQPPRNPYENAICNHQDRNNPNHVHTHACPQGQPPAQERASDAAQVSILRTTCDCHILTIEAMQREIDELKVSLATAAQPAPQKKET